MLNELPQGWVECKLGDVLYLQNGFAFKSKDYGAKGVTIVRNSDIFDNNVSIDKAVRIDDTNISDCYKISKGDFLIAMSGATTGKTGTYNYTECSYLNQRVGNLKIYSKNVLLPRYRDFFIANNRKEIEKKAYG